MTPSHPDDLRERPFSDLLDQARSGGRTAQQELVLRYQERVLRAVRRRLSPTLRKHYDSLDIANSVFGDAMAGISTFENRGESAFLRWLRIVVRNKVNARLRHHLRAEGGRREESDHGRSELVTTRRTPDQIVARAELADRTRRLVDRLTPEQRSIVSLRLDRDYPFAAIAEELDLPSADAARKRFNRCLKELRRLSGKG